MNIFPIFQCSYDLLYKLKTAYFLPLMLPCNRDICVILFWNWFQYFICSGDEIPDLLKYPLKRKKKLDENLEDIYDGKLYKKHFAQDGFFHQTSEATKEKEIHLSLQINTDGVSLFRSSKFCVWPVYFIVNELPPKVR